MQDTLPRKRQSWGISSNPENRPSSSICRKLKAITKLGSL
jgi:hypothetical protein